MKAVIDGVDYTSDIASKDGYAIRYVPKTSGEAFTSIGAVDYDNKIGYKAEVSLAFDPMEESRMSELLGKLMTKKYVPLIYDDPSPAFGNDRSIETKLADIDTQIVISNVNGTNYWSGLSIVLAER